MTAPRFISLAARLLLGVATVALVALELAMLVWAFHVAPYGRP